MDHVGRVGARTDVPETGRRMRIDAHQHYWDGNGFDSGWARVGLPAVDAIFLPGGRPAAGDAMDGPDGGEPIDIFDDAVIAPGLVNAEAWVPG